MSLNEEDPVGAHPDNAMAAAIGANTNFLIMLSFSKENTFKCGNYFAVNRPEGHKN
jgi:hypothetical protein